MTKVQFPGLVTAYAGAAIALTVAAIPGAAFAQSNTVDVPQGCTAFLTVQSRSCIVSHMWTCQGDPEGTHWRLSIGPNGPFGLSFTDSEFRWLKSYDLVGGTTSTLVEPEEDPASVTELLANGTDSMSFVVRREGPSGTEERQYTGFDMLTGELAEIDGHVLMRTEFSYQYGSGQNAQRVSGRQFISPELRMFFGGTETTTLPDGGTVEDDYTPMDFAGPGEPGFLAAQPLYDCGDTMSQLDRLRSVERTAG